MNHGYVVGSGVVIIGLIANRSLTRNEGKIVAISGFSMLVAATALELLGHLF